MIANRQGGGSKWLWGCLGGCFGFIVIVGILVAVGIHMLLRAVPVVPPETFVVAGPTAFLSVRVEPDDALMAELPVRIASDPAFQAQLPPQQAQQVRRNISEGSQNVRSLAPMQVVAVFEPDEAEETFHFGVAVSVYRYSGLFGFFFGQATAAGSQSKYKDVTVTASPQGRFLARRRNNFLVADRKKLLHRWIDRLEQQRAREEQAGEGETPVPELDVDERLKGAYERLNRRSAVLFASLNANGELARLLEEMPEGDVREAILATGLTSEKVLSVCGQIESLSATDALLTVWVECADAEHAALVEEGLAGFLEQAREALSVSEVQTKRVPDDLLRLEVRIEDLPGLMARRMAGPPQQAQDRQPPAATLPSPSQ